MALQPKTKTNLLPLRYSLCVPVPTLYLTLGFPGSGKTRFALAFAEEQNLAHLNSDKFRLEMFEQPTYTPEENGSVFEVMDLIAEELLKMGVSVIYDANFNRRTYRRAMEKTASRHGAKVILLWFQTPVDTALVRIGNRGDGKSKLFRNISPQVLHNLRDELEEPP